MSNKAVEVLENILCDNAKEYLIPDWIDEVLDKIPKVFSYFFRKCSEQVLVYQDVTCSSIIHGLVKSHISSSNKMKSLKILLVRGVNCNKLDGNKKSVLDYLAEDNDWECIKILLEHGQNLIISENCLSRVFQLRNTHEKVFRLLFAYAIEHKVAPNRTGISDGDTFLHEIMIHEKEMVLFKKWMGFFLSFPEINMNAINNDGLTIFDLLLLNYKKRRCKCAIKLLIKYRINKFSKIDSVQPQLFSFKSQITKKICNYYSKKTFSSTSMLNNENLELNTKNNELSIISSGKGFSHKYLKLKQAPMWSSAKSSQTLNKSSNDILSLVTLPNYEETEITFEVEIFDKTPQRGKIKQTHLSELAKAKKYLSSKEAIFLIKEDNHKALPCQPKMIAESNKGGYMKETKTDSVSNIKSTQQLSQESSTIVSSVKNTWNKNLLLNGQTKDIYNHANYLHLSLDKATLYIEHYNRGCVRLDVSECIIQGPATTPCEVIATHPVLETKLNRELHSQNASDQKQKETSLLLEALPLLEMNKHTFKGTILCKQRIENNSVTTHFSNKIDRPYNCFEKMKGLSQVHSLTIACLQDNPSCRPTVEQLHCICTGYFEPIILLHSRVSEISIQVDKEYSIASLMFSPDENTFKGADIKLFATKSWENLMMMPKFNKLSKLVNILELHNCYLWENYNLFLRLKVNHSYVNEIFISHFILVYTARYSHNSTSIHFPCNERKYFEEKREILSLIILLINENQGYTYSYAETAYGTGKLLQLKQPKHNKDLSTSTQISINDQINTSFPKAVSQNVTIIKNIPEDIDIFDQLFKTYKSDSLEILQSHVQSICSTEIFLQTCYEYLQFHEDKIHEKTELSTSIYKTAAVSLKDGTDIKKSSFPVLLHSKCYEYYLSTNHIYKIFPCRLLFDTFHIITFIQNCQYAAILQVDLNIVPYSALLHDQNVKFVKNKVELIKLYLLIFFTKDMDITKAYNKTLKVENKDTVRNIIIITDTICKVMKLYIRDNNIIDEVAHDIAAFMMYNNTQLQQFVDDSENAFKIARPLQISTNNIHKPPADDFENAISWNIQLQKLDVSKNLYLKTHIIIATCLQNISKFQELCISNNNISDGVVDDNAATIYSNTQPKKFNVDKNLQSIDAIKITEALQIPCILKELDFNNNNIGDEADDNSATIHCYTPLQQFNDDKNIFTLMELDINDNYIIADHLAPAISYSTKLQELDIDMTGLHAEDITKITKVITKVLQNKATLNKFYISSITDKAINDNAATICCYTKLQQFIKTRMHIKTLQNITVLYKRNTDEGVNNIATICTQLQEHFDQLHQNGILSIVRVLQIKDNRFAAKIVAVVVPFNNIKLQTLVPSKNVTALLQDQRKLTATYIVPFDCKSNEFNTQLCLELNLQHGGKLVALLEYDLSLIFKNTNRDKKLIPFKNFILKYNYTASHLFLNYIKSANKKELALGMQSRKTIITAIVHKNENITDGIVAVLINIADIHLCKTYLQTNELNSVCDEGKKSEANISTQGFIVSTLDNTCSLEISLKESCTFIKELQKLYWNESIFKKTEIQKNSLQLCYGKERPLQHTYLFSKFSSDSMKQSEEISQTHMMSTWLDFVETENTDKNNPATAKELPQSTNSRDPHCTDSNDAEHLQEGNNEVEISTPCQVIDDYFQQDKEIFCFNVQKDHLHAFEDLNSEANVDICGNNQPESLTFRFNRCNVENESCDATCRYASNDAPFISNNVLESRSTTAQESFQHFVQPPESLSVNVIGQRICVPSHSVPTISCSDISISETVLQDSVLFGKEENAKRGKGDGSDSSSDEDNNDQGIHSSFASHYGSRSSVLQTSARTSIGAKYPDGRLREAVAPPQAFMGVDMSMGIHTKPSRVHSSSGDYLISSNLAERGPILLDIPNGRNELVIAAHSNLSIPKLYPIVGFRKEPPGIALPPPIPLDLPKIDFSKKVSSSRQVVRQQPVQTGYDVGTVPKTLPTSNATRPQLMASGHQQLTLSQSIDLSDPVSIIDRAALFLSAGDYGATIKVLEILDKHLLLPDEVDMAKEFGQGLANFKNLHYRAAKPCFTALFEKATNHHSTGDQALASIYLGEIEMSWAKYKDAVKHFTIAVTNYSTDNVAEKFQQTILSKSAVLVKKGHCHRSLSQIKEAINAFKLAKEVAESRQEQAVGSKLKTAKEDELSAICALGNILQSIGDYEQSFDYYQKSLKLAVELGDHVSIGWAHGNLGNAMLGLDQKDKALDHLITAFHMSARYEGNPLAVGRAVSNLGNAYQAIGNLPKAKEHYEIALGHAIYGNDLQGQGRACGNIGNIYMLLKEPVKAVHYYTETLRLSTDKNTKITGHHNRGCARFDVAECIIQGKKPKELVPATTPGSEYGRLAIKLTDEVITTDPVLETKPNRETSAQSISEQRESSMPVEAVLPIIIKGKAYEGIGNVEIIRTAETLPFLETAQRDLFEAIQSHEQGVQNVKGSHEALSLSLSLFESNSRSFYKMQETLVELGRLYQQLSRLGLMDMAATDPQEFKNALVYGEQARARTLGELVLQKKKATYSDLFSISTPLTIQDIYKTVNLQKVPVVFLSYCVSKLLMWIMVKKKDEVVMRCQSIELKEEDLENGSFELYIRYNLLQFLSKDEIYIFRRCAYEQESPFSVLHDVIAIKIIEGLKSVGFSEVTEFIVIPDSVTHLLPFSPLMNKHNWQFFGDKYRIRIVPSFLSLLVMSMTSNPVVEIPGDKNDFLIAGNPTIPPFMYDSTQWNLGRLPYAEKEAISVANIIGTIPVLREQATKQSVLYRLRSAKVIHLATHGSASGGFLAFTSSFPISKSGLAEKEHILIFPKEIETLNISPALVVLSSCDSARGQVKAEGVIGMARAFLSAGAHSVLVSLWRVPDESANVFMNFFYQFLVNGLPSLQALQRSMQCLRCFLKYSHYVHWSGFQIIGKEVSFHKNSSAQFPIQKLLGEVSIFPRPQVKIIEENLLGVKNKIFTDIQFLVGTPGNEPEECARDFIKNCYYYYPCGVYWYDATNELLLETSMKIAREMPLKGAVYKEQKEPDPLPTISNPSLLTTKSNKPTSRKDKRLIVLHNFTSLENYHSIMREMKDASTDIIVVSNELFCKEEVAKEFDKHFNRGCNIIEVGNLQPISILQRIVYGLLEKNSFVVRDADHIVFTLLSEYSRGAATVVHMLTSLMQKSDDNSRTGFELAKQQLKLHIAHLKLGLDKHGILNTLNKAEFFVNPAGKVQHRGKDVATEEFGIIDSGHLSACQRLQRPDDDVNKQDNGGKLKQNDNGSESPITIIPESHIIQESCAVPSGDDKPPNRKTLIKPISMKAKGFKKSSNSQPEDEHTMKSSIIAKSDDDKHIISFDATHPPDAIELEKEGFVSTKKHPLYLYINDILNTTSNISLPAHHLLKSLTITGPIPLPWFYVEQLDNVVMNAVFNKEKKRIQAESPMNQLIKEGVIRRSCYPILYHKDLDTDYIDLSIQQMTVPKLICDAVKDEMDCTDKVLAVLSAQQALENLTNEIKPSLIHLQYIFILSNQLHDVCTKQLHSHGDELLIAIQKLNLRIAIMASQLKS